MTFGIGEKRYSHRGGRVSADSGGAIPALNGWAGIEHHLLIYDVDRIQGYAEDIDTLLVFAGLFSSILSAFVVQTYQLLQQDNFQVTNQLLAFGISQFVSLASIASAPQVDATIKDLLGSSSFSVPTNARWINALFFTSMVLSLAAALFGIRAKQWLRKYMQWNSPLNTPRDNILVRQIRVESWESWNIDVTISFIPALLELAMILFLAGIVVLLWTLDDVVAKAITTIVAVFLVIIAAFTILPIFFKRCPYKSPISWALVATSSAIASLTASYLRLLRMVLVVFLNEKNDASNPLLDSGSASSLRFTLLTRIRALLLKGVWISRDWEKNITSSWAPNLTTWRERDSDSARITGLRFGNWWQKARDALGAAEVELAQELVPLDEDGNFTREPMSASGSLPVPEGHPEALLTDISQSALLVRALSWVQRESQDMQISKYLRECISSLHPEESLKLSNISWYSSHIVADWCIASAIFAGDPVHESQLALLPDGESVSSKPRTVTGLRRALAVFVDPWDNSDDETAEFKMDLAASRPFWNNRKAESHILLLVLYADLQHIIALLHVSRDDFPLRTRTLKRRAYELISVLNQALHSYERGRRKADCYYYIDRLGPVLSDMISFSIRQSDSFPAVTVLGLKALEVAYTVAKVTVDSGGNIEVSSGQMERAYYKTLLMNYFVGDFRDYGECKLNMYVLTVVRYFNYSNLAHCGITLSDILTNMVKAVEASTETYPERVRHPDIDVDDRAWVYALCAEEDFLTQAHGPTFRRILHLFEYHYRQKNLAGDQRKIREYLHSSLATSHADRDTCEDEHCRWLPNAHPCGPGGGYDVPEACHLLPIHDHRYSGSYYPGDEDEGEESPLLNSPSPEGVGTQLSGTISGRWRIPIKLRGWFRRASARADIVDVEMAPGTPGTLERDSEDKDLHNGDAEGPQDGALRSPSLEYARDDDPSIPSLNVAPLHTIPVDHDIPLLHIDSTHNGHTASIDRDSTRPEFNGIVREKKVLPSNDKDGTIP